MQPHPTAPRTTARTPAPLRTIPQGRHRLTGRTGTWGVGAGSPSAASLAGIWFLALQSPTPALTCLQQRRSVRGRPQPRASESSANQPGWAKGPQPCCGVRAAPASPGTGHPTVAALVARAATRSIIGPTATGGNSPPKALAPQTPLGIHCLGPAAGKSHRALTEPSCLAAPAPFPCAVTAGAQLLRPPTRRPSPHRP